MAEIADKIKEMDALAKKAHKGDAESMFQLAVRRYWEYDKFPGIETRECAFKMLHAAGQHGDSRMNRKVGDFFRNEFQETRAQTHYEMALMKAMEEAQTGNYDVTSSIAEQYALGIGVPQSDEKAAFWTQWGAHHGNDEDRAMVKNLWQDGSVLPVSEEMASAITERGITASEPKCADFEEIYDAASRIGVLSDHLDILKRLEEKKHRRVKVTDKSQLAEGKLRSTIAEIISNAFSTVMFVIILVSIMGFFVTNYWGYRESGIISIFNKMFYFGFGFPLRLWSRVFYKLPFSETGIKYVCECFYAEPEIGIGLEWIFQQTFTFIIGMILLGIWFLILCFIYVCTIETFCEHIKVRQISISYDYQITYRPQIEKMEKNLEQVERKLSDLIRKYDIPDHMCSHAALLALYDLAAYQGYGSVSETVCAYQNLIDREEKPVFPIDVGCVSSLLPLYFTMNRLMPGSAQYAGICSDPKYNFSEYSDFMDGYIEYRQGKRFDRAERDLRDALENSKKMAEKGFAAWYLSLICEEEHLSANRNQSIRNAHNKKCLEEAATLRNKAKLYGCPYANTESVGGCKRLWQARYNSLISLAEYYRENKNLYRYFTFFANADRKRMHECGNPLNAAEWNGYKTDCIWPIYDEIMETYSEHCDDSALYRAQGKMPVWDCGVYRISELRAEVERRINEATERAKNRSVSEAVNAQKRYTKEVLPTREWERQQDARERDRNLFLHHDYDTDFGRSLRGEMSQEEFLVQDMLRGEARRKFQEEMDDD